MLNLTNISNTHNFCFLSRGSLHSKKFWGADRKMPRSEISIHYYYIYMKATWKTTCVMRTYIVAIVHTQKQETSQFYNKKGVVLYSFSCNVKVFSCYRSIFLQSKNIFPTQPNNFPVTEQQIFPFLARFYLARKKVSIELRLT